MKTILVNIFFLFLLAGCTNYISRYTFDYNRMDALEIEYNSNSEIYAGYKHSFEDNILKIYLDCDPYRIGFYIINKADAPLRVIWDSVKVYADSNKDAPITITHSNKSQEEIEIPDSSSSQFSKMNQLIELRKEDSVYVIKPTIILPNETLMDEVIPKQNNNWLPYKMSDKEKLKNESDKVIGTKVELKFPIKIEDEVKTYIFSFTVKDYQILKKG